MSEQFNLTWNRFQSTISSSLDILRKEGEFFDVTLVSHDQRQMPAHKVLLSAASPFFKTVLKRNPHQHPLIYLSDVDSHHLLSILDYIYLGQVQMPQERVQDFLAAGTKLQISGLSSETPAQPFNPPLGTTDSNGIMAKRGRGRPRKKSVLHPSNSYETLGEEARESLGDADDSVKMKQGRRQSLFMANTSGYETPNEFVQEPSIGVETMVPAKTEKIQVGDMKQLEDKIMELAQYSEIHKMFICRVCGKTSKNQSKAMVHVETHLEGMTFSCLLCGNAYKTREHLRVHSYRCPAAKANTPADPVNTEVADEQVMSGDDQFILGDPVMEEYVA